LTAGVGDFKLSAVEPVTTAAIALVPEPQPAPKPKRMPPIETRFKKGVSGNPSGKPRNAMTLTGAVKMILAGRTRCPRERNRLLWNVAMQWVQRARSNPTDLAMLLERTEGKVMQPVENKLLVDANRAIMEAYAAAQLETSDEEGSVP